MEMQIKIIQDNTDEVIAAKDAAVMRALEAIGLQAEGYAKLKAPVDTGLLRNSITHAVSGQKPALEKYKSNKTHASTKATEKAGTAGKAVSPVREGSYSDSAPGGEDAVYIGTNVEYAPYVEYGTRRTKAQPFLKPAVQDHAEEYKKIAERFLKGQ